MLFQELKHDITDGKPIVSITVVYDNNSFPDGITTDWGFACVVEIDGTKLLFDTGDNGAILLGNMQKLKINPHAIDYVVLSHYHHDHTGGLNDFLKTRPGIKVYYPASFPIELIDAMKTNAAVPIPVTSFREIRTNVFTLGEIDGKIPEQAIAIRSSKGIILITGCAHPGIIKFLEIAGELFRDEPIYMIIGGFHLHKTNEKEITAIVDGFKKQGVINVAPTHCTGDKARVIFEKEYKEEFIKTGVGKVIII